MYLKRFIEKFGTNKFEYNNEIPNKSNVKFIVTCNTHGDFSTTPDLLRKGNGCYKCGIIKKLTHKLNLLKKMLKILKKYIGDLYLYNNPTSLGRIPFIVTCKIHGDFSVSPNNHKRGRGCPFCAKENRQGGWKPKEWEQSALNSENFDNYKIYIIHCFNANEEFVKIGKTYRTLEDRFPSYTSLPYSYKILKIKTFENAFNCSEVENKLHKQFKNNKYKPNIYFKGINECFDLSIINTLNTNDI